jgi:hypothetical protein
VYQSNLDYTFKTERKLMPKWSSPYWVMDRATNTYALARLDSTPISREFSTRHLRAFIPPPESQLEKDQQKWEAKHREQAEGGPEMVRVGQRQLELAEVMVWTPHFVRGEHGVGIKGQVGQMQQDRSYDKAVAHSTHSS